MLAAALILFREVLEAALIIGILGAATRNLAHRSRWIAGGVALGVVGAFILAAAASAITQLAEGVGQELLNAGILGVAVIMLAWHNIWMAQHGRELARQANAVGSGIREGKQSITVLLSVIGLAVLREGAEVVLFLQGIVAQGGSDGYDMFKGAALGVVAGAAVGWLLYLGLLRIPLKWFFQVTSVMILLLAAGMAGQAARFLVQADKLPPLADPLWDVSNLLSNNSALGTLLHALAGYDAHPLGMQMLFYCMTFVLIAVAMHWFKTK